MRNLKLAAAALAVSVSFGTLSAKADPPQGRKQKARNVLATGRDDGRTLTPAETAAERKLEQMTSRSDEGLDPVVRPDGVVAVDLEERFQHVARAVPDGKGGYRMVCNDDHGKAKKQLGPVYKAAPALEEK